MKMKGDYYRYQCEVIKAPDTVEEEGHNSECCPPFYYLGGCILYIAATFPIVWMNMGYSLSRQCEIWVTNPWLREFVLSTLLFVVVKIELLSWHFFFTSEPCCCFFCLFFLFISRRSHSPFVVLYILVSLHNFFLSLFYLLDVFSLFYRLFLKPCRITNFWSPPRIEPRTACLTHKLSATELRQPAGKQTLYC